MRIGCLQFAPQVGDVDNNLNRADAVLSKANPENLDLLVLPELAFSGYNFKSLRDIAPFLEPTGAGITSLWARTTALKYNCPVAAGYPEKVDVAYKWPASPEYYNSMIMVNEDGETVANYRKTHLYPTDETWALENPGGFIDGHIDGLGKVVMGIGMDLNPYRFEAPWKSYELSFHILNVQANVVILSMCWVTNEPAREFSRMPQEPDMDTLTYWVRRLEPIIRSESAEETIVIFANRTGSEGDLVYAGTSAVIGVKDGEVSVYGLLGRGEKALLTVDTNTQPFAKLVYRPEKDYGVMGKIVKSNTASPIDQKVNIDRSKSPALSLTSKISGKTELQTPESETSDGFLGVPKERARRVFGGHVFISQEPLSPAAGSFPATPFEESPLSPRYFWSPPENPLEIPGNRLSLSSSTKSNDGDRPVNWGQMEASPASELRHISEMLAENNQIPDSSMISNMMDELRKATSTRTAGQGNGPDRPSSPKSRNCSRSGFRERSDSTVQQRPVSVFASRVPNPTPDDKRQHQRSESWNPKSNRKRSSVVRNFGLDLSRAATASPDMEKIGADLLVFEEGTRPRRDSLECHADEDDFVVLHSSQREQKPTPSSSSPATSPKKPHTPTSNTTTATSRPPRREARSGSRTTTGNPGDRSSSRREPTPRLFESTSSRRQTPSRQSSVDSRRQALQKSSPDRPTTTSARDISRGRPRNTAWSRTATQTRSSPAPIPSSYSSQHPSAMGSPPYQRNKESNLTSSGTTSSAASPPFSSRSPRSFTVADGFVAVESDEKSRASSTTANRRNPNAAGGAPPSSSSSSSRRRRKTPSLSRPPPSRRRTNSINNNNPPQQQQPKTEAIFSSDSVISTQVVEVEVVPPPRKTSSRTRTTTLTLSSSPSSYYDDPMIMTTPRAMTLPPLEDSYDLGGEVGRGGGRGEKVSSSSSSLSSRVVLGKDNQQQHQPIMMKNPSPSSYPLFESPPPYSRFQQEDNNLHMNMGMDLGMGLVGMDMDMAAAAARPILTSSLGGDAGVGGGVRALGNTAVW